MNIAYQQIYALIFSIAIIVPLSGMENNVAGIEPEMVREAVVNSVAWYKNPKIQLAAAITTAAAGYTFAARMGRAAVPAFIVTLCALVLGSKKVEASDVVQNEQNNDSVGQPTPTPVQDTQDHVTSHDVTQQLGDITKRFVTKYNEMVTVLKNTPWDQYQDAAAQIDYQAIEEKRLA